VFLATLLGVAGRDLWASKVNPAVLARRLWARFEVVPFRYGMVALAGTLAVASMLVAGLLSLGGGEGPDRSPRPAGRSPVEAAAPPAPTWGAYVPPRPARPTRVAAIPRTVVPRTRPPARAGSPRPSSSVTCPPSLKKWSWMWEMCRHRPNG
jgi:hypothetical protein